MPVPVDAKIDFPSHMKLQRCANPACRRPYQVNEFSGRKLSAQEPEEIVCPHCGHGETQWSNSVFLVHALSPEQEAEFERNHPH